MRSRRSRPSHRSSHSRTTTSEPNGDTQGDLEAAPPSDGESDYDFIEDKRAIIARSEEPGIDSLRMTGGAIGTIIRARRRATALSVASASRSRLSASLNGSAHSHDMSRGGTARRDSLSPVPHRSWFRALTSTQRPEHSRSPQRTVSHLPDVSEKPDATVSTTEVSGLPATSMVDSPLSGSPVASDGLPSPGITDDTRSLSRVLGGDELPAPPGVSAEDRPRRPSIRFQTSTPNVQVTPATLTRPTMGVEVGEDAPATRSRTMPSVFTETERVRAEEVRRELSEK